MSSIELKKATPKDAEEIAMLQVLMAKETENLELHYETVLSGANTVINDPGRGFYLLAVEEGTIKGCLMILYEWSDWRNSSVLWIHSVYVKPEYRKQGIYTLMYSEIQRMVNENEGYAGIRLFVDKTNNKAQKVYEKCGMNGEHYKLFEWMKDF